MNNKEWGAMNIEELQKLLGEMYLNEKYKTNDKLVIK